MVYITSLIWKPKACLPRALKPGINNSIGNLPKEIDTSHITKFALGPLNQAVLWEGERAKMVLDRGPCKLKPFIYTAIALN